MDALELLKQDHQKISSLFNLGTRAFDRLKMELWSHSTAEEQVLYPVFGRYEELSKIVGSFKEEHQRIDALLEECVALSGNPEELEIKLGELRSLVEAHVNREESELFPAVRRMMRRPEREQLGRHIEAVKHTPPSRRIAA